MLSLAFVFFRGRFNAVAGTRGSLSVLLIPCRNHFIPLIRVQRRYQVIWRLSRFARTT